MKILRNQNERKATKSELFSLRFDMSKGLSIKPKITSSLGSKIKRVTGAAALGVLRDQRALMPLRELIMEAEELGELEDTALKSFKKIMAANWQSIPGATPQKKPAGTF